MREGETEGGRDRERDEILSNVFSPLLYPWQPSSRERCAAEAIARVNHNPKITRSTLRTVYVNHTSNTHHSYHMTHICNHTHPHPHQHTLLHTYSIGLHNMIELWLFSIYWFATCLTIYENHQ